MKPLSFVLLFVTFLIGCQGSHRDSGAKATVGNSTRSVPEFSQVTIALDRPSPNVDMTSYILITNNVDADRREADAIMQVRAKLPQAVQTKDAALFDRILGRSFTFRSEEEFWNRPQYIRDRIEEPERVESARYENLVLQVFGDLAVSTYRNVIQLKQPNGKTESVYMTWASVYVKEDGEWKIGAVHMIDMKP